MAIPKEDGYELWLRYRLIQPADLLATYRQQVNSSIVVPGDSPTMAAIRSEMQCGLTGLLGEHVDVSQGRLQQGGVLIGTPTTSPQVAALGWHAQIKVLGSEGYKIASTLVDEQPAIVVAARGELGALYGSFHLLRLLQTHQALTGLAITERPRIQNRLLNHWDNLDGSIERGYAGRSLWKWQELPDVIDPRYRDYARACASIGINGAALNNTNARSESLSAEYLRKTAAVADALRPYGVRVFLSARFSAPMELGRLDTADPLDDQVRRWWRAKADEIYQLIPDMGGFLIKADSEGQPGPFGYKRTHADGANVLAQALAPHGGVVLWRAFVYGHGEADRAKSAYANFKPLDGDFAPNVFVQAKNGPIDFQPREPAQPLFGAVPRTPLAMEFQITQEYLGQSIHLVYLAPMWKEILDWDTFAQGEGSTVGRVIDGSLHGQPMSAIASVANTGSDRNWCGHHFAQANWYAFGRLAWDHQLSSETIAQEWIRTTFTNETRAVASILDIMMSSWEACINYMTPLGLHHIMREGHHYGPDPSYDAGHRADWRSTYYHRADAEGLGFDRSSRGSNAVEQYYPPLRELFDDLATCPEKYLLWFHHVPWTHKLRSGRTLWEELAWRYVQGVEAVSGMLEAWETLETDVDPQRYREVLGKLITHLAHAAEWPQVCLPYFQRFSRQPIPPGATGLIHT
jgi:alpha-glucuronidase